MKRQPLIRAGTVLGFGMGGFFDGIVLHQLLQWHHLVSNVYPDSTVEGLQLNTLWDGIFHASMYLITLVGLIMVWRAVHRDDVIQSPRVLFGAALVGFGIFHLFDSIVNHWILRIHNIRPGANVLLYDIGYFAIGVILLVIGAGLIRARRETA